LRLSPERTRTVAWAAWWVEPEVVAVGIDVAEASLDVAVRPSGEQRHWSNYSSGIVGTIAWLQSLNPGVIVVEATGGYEAPVVAVLGLAGLPVAVVNPRQVRDFVRATGRLAKTDRLDAQVLAHFAAALRPEPRPRCSSAAAKSWQCGPRNRIGRARHR
jgi:transposase